jgi:hypothetical protein
VHCSVKNAAPQSATVDFIEQLAEKTIALSDISAFCAMQPKCSTVVFVEQFAKNEPGLSHSLTNSWSVFSICADRETVLHCLSHPITTDGRGNIKRTEPQKCTRCVKWEDLWKENNGPTDAMLHRDFQWSFSAMNEPIHKGEGPICQWGPSPRLPKERKEKQHSAAPPPRSGGSLIVGESDRRDPQMSVHRLGKPAFKPKRVWPLPPLPFQKNYKGQIYNIVGTRPYVRCNGVEIVLYIVRSRCADCGAWFQFALSRRLLEHFRPNRRCRQHAQRGKKVKAAMRSIPDHNSK